MDPVRQIADAVLYEGYILWPYRRSATKNQQRWTFGGVYPRAHSEGRDDDPWLMQTECLLRADPGATVEVAVRFLHVVRRELLRGAGREAEPVHELVIDGERYLAWDEAKERELDLPPLRVADGEARARIPLEVEAGREGEELLDRGGNVAGAIVRSWERLDGEVEACCRPAGAGVLRITVRIANHTPCAAEGPRDAALRRTLCSTHTVLRAERGEFVSLADPPPKLAAEAAACRNEGTWPVLVGERGDRHTVLSSPIILEDHPRVAPESTGDLFDGGEIDELLMLNILSLTEAEKDEMRASDPRAREILERAESLGQDELMRLHGAIREFGMAR